MKKELSPQTLLIQLLVELFVSLVVFYITQNIVVSLIALALLIGVTFLVIYLRSYFQVLRSSGLRRVYFDRDISLKYIKKRFPLSRDVRILAIRGWSILGSDRGTFVRIIRSLPNDWPGKVRVLLGSPDAGFTKRRGSEVGLDPTMYDEQCRKVSLFLKQLVADLGVDLELRLYDSAPLWRGTLFEKEGLISYYTTKTEEPEAPLYEVHAGDGALFNAFSKTFEQMWQDSSSAW